jgi:DNA-binding beta-propeller fold protein YncE
MSLQDEIQSDLDKINAVVRISELTTLMTFTTPGSDPGRIVVAGIDVYVLDKGTQRLYKFLLAPNGNALQELLVDPVLLRRGDTVGSIVVGDLLDIFWVPAGGVRRTDNLMCLESGGSVLEYAPERTPGLRSLPLADSKAWLKVRAAAGYGGNVYLLDTQRNAIIKYVPTTSGYNNPPLGYLDQTVRADLTNTVDMAIDGDVYILVLDGQVWRFHLSKPLTFPRTDLDKPMPNPASIFTSEAAQSVYVVDAANKRIVQFSKDGVFQRQFRYAGFDGAFDSLKAVFVDEEHSVMYITSGDKLYLARIPR